MKRLQKSPILFLLSFILMFLWTGCGSTENSPNFSSAPSEELSDPGVTMIEIDGEGDDWDNRPLLHEDDFGDAEGDFLDVGKVFAFLNQDSLYVLIELANPGADFEQFDFEISADGQHQLFTWHKSFDKFGKFGNSEFAVGSVMEGKIDLDDIGSPEASVTISQIRVMAGETPPSETWRAVDELNLKPQYLAWVDEVDLVEKPIAASQNTTSEDAGSENNEVPPPEDTPAPAEHVFLSDEPFEERGSLVWLEQQQTTAEFLHRQLSMGGQEVELGPDGNIYIADGDHIIQVTPDGELDDLGLWKNHLDLRKYGTNAIEFDLDGNLFFNTGNMLYRLNTDGSIDFIFEAAQAPYIRSLTMNKDGTLYYSLNNGMIYRWNPDSEDELLNSDYQDPDIHIGEGGQLYISDYGQDQVIVLDVNTGETNVFASGYFRSEGAYINNDPWGNIWTRGTGFLNKFSPEGEIIPIMIDGQPGEDFRWHLGGDIEFDLEGNLWVAYASGEILRLKPVDPNQPDLNEFTSEWVYLAFEAADIAVGPDGKIYASNLYPGNIWQFDLDGSYEIIWEHGDQGRIGLAVDDQGVLYAGTIFGEILKMENGQISHYASGIYTERLIIAGDGNLYAAVGKYWAGEPSQIFRITGVDTYEMVATEIDGVSFGSEPIQITPAMDHGLYVINQSNGTLYYMDFEGNGYPLIQLANETQFTVLASSPVTGKIYFISHLVKGNETVIQRYALYEYEPGGEFRMISPEIGGDPWGMDFSPDGKFLYVAEAGGIVIIPIEDVQP